MLHLNGWFGEIRCAAKRLPLHMRANAASAIAARAKGGFVRRAAIHGVFWRTRIDACAANGGNEPYLPFVALCTKVSFQIDLDAGEIWVRDVISY